MSSSRSLELGRLREVTGIGAKRAKRIVAGWGEPKVIREIMLFLRSMASAPRARSSSIRPIAPRLSSAFSENSCRLARDIRDIGFRTADQIAAKLGIEKGRTDPRAPGTS